MIKRTFLIDNFKSIKSEYLELNHITSLEESIGGVITLIGPNNSGKSNVLQALLAYHKNQYSNEDFREENGIFLKDKLDLSISLVMNNDVNKLTKNSDGVTFNEKKLLNNRRYNLFSIISFDEYRSFNRQSGSSQDVKIGYFINSLILYFSFYDRLTIYEKNSKLYEITKEIKKNLDNGNISFTQLLEPLVSFLSNGHLSLLFKQEYINTHKDTINLLIASKTDFSIQDTIKNIIYTLRNYFALIPSNLNRELLDKKFGDNKANDEDLEEMHKISSLPIKIAPKVMIYDDKVGFSNEDLVYYSNKNKSNIHFYDLLFKLIGDITLEDLNQAYKNFQNNGSTSKAGLNNFQKKVNKKLEKISLDFSNIYHINHQQYRFELELESDKVFFLIFEGDNAINLDRQSTGFKWFFNFYFSMYSGNGLEAGDIVVMDEPATNLHVSGQIELLKFIREFGKNNNILFILSTHSPFLIDIDYLDEIRIIQKDDEGTHITNKFNVIKEAGKRNRTSDITAPIRSSLTIQPNNMIGLNQVVVFVEGITDYGYLIAMRNKLKFTHPEFERLKFIPFDGVSDEKKNVKTNVHEIFTQLVYAPVVLVDADVAGQDFVMKNKNNKMDVITLKDIHESFKEIEDLFDGTDKKVLKLEEKKSPIAMKLKNNPHLIENLSAKSLQNFELLFKSLLK